MEISESAWAKAKEICTGVGADPYSQKIICEKIARAIMEERRECAELVASVEVNLIEYPYEDAGKYYQAGAIDACLSASQAIRNK